MRYISAIFISFFFSISFLSAQSDSSATILNAFDFWIGDWDVHWMNPDSSFTYGTNEIVKTLDGKVIQENFIDLESGFKGSSLSVFSVVDSTWHQAWTDNAGGYLEFTGIIEDERRIFQAAPRLRNDTMIVQRMVFYDINEDKFMWDWEVSKDEGKTWSLVWQIFYERKVED